MKKMTNVMLAVVGCLLFVSGIQSCKKTENNPPGTPAPTITSFTPTTARTADVVTITGTNFTGASVVTFGGTPASSFTVVNATTITAVVGGGASGAVAVTTPGGTISKAGFTFDSSLPDINGYSNSNEVEADALIAYWPFDGSTAESTNGGAPVATGGTNSFVPGVIGQAIKFNNGFLGYGSAATDAGADNTTFGSNDTLQYGFTVSLWAQVPDTSTLTTLFAVNFPAFANWPILGITYRRHNGGTAFDFNGGLGNVDGTGPHLSYADAFVGNAFNDSLTWAFLTMTYSPGDGNNPVTGGVPARLRYYANGQLRATVDLNFLASNPFPDYTAALLLLAPNNVTIGAAGGVIPAGLPGAGTATVPGATDAIPGFMNTGITGSIDDIRFFKRQLTDIQVESLFLLGKEGR